MREDVGHKVGWVWNHLGQRRSGGVSSCHRKTVEAAEHFVFAVPEARDGTGPSDVGLHAIGCNLGYGDVSHGSTKRPQSTSLGVESHAHRLFVGDVLGSESGQFHRRPRRSKFATSRNPTKSTLA